VGIGDHPTDHEVSLEIARRLRDVPRRPELVEAIRFVIMFLYARSGSQSFEQDLLPLFAGTPAEQEYRAMATHYVRIMERRRAYEMGNDPEEIARRKALKKAEKRERLAKRALPKAEIGNWLERRALQPRSKDR